MAMVINSNIMSLNAQRNLAASQNDLNTAMERLSSGKRINSAADDAAGLAITNRITSQVRGLNQAIRNANDGISIIQTAEGALDATSNILQRMRELAIQSSSGTYNDQNRATMQAEVAQLKSEMDRIATSTAFNGLNILDGTISNLGLQVGDEAGQQVEFSIGEITTAKLGVSETGGVSAIGVASALSTGDLTINGIGVPATKVGDDTASTVDSDQSAIAKAAAINSVYDQTGVKALVDENIVAGTSMTAAASATDGTVTLNGYEFDVTVSADTAATRASIVETINAKSLETGIVATDSGNDTGGITLMAEDGRNIKIEFGTGITDANTGLAAASTYTGGFTLVADTDTDSIVIGGGAAENAGLTDGSYEPGVAVVTSTRAAAAGSTAASVEAPETAVATFTALNSGESVTVGGLTFTAGSNMDAASVAAAFANMSDGDSGIYETFTIDFSSAGYDAQNIDTISLDGTSYDIADLDYTGNGAALATAIYNQIVADEGSANTTNYAVTDDGSGVLTFTATAPGAQADLTAVITDTGSNGGVGTPEVTNTVDGAAGVDGTYTNALSGYDTSAASGTTVTFTSTEPEANASNVEDITITTDAAGAGAPTLTTVTDGADAVAEVFTTTFGALITDASDGASITFDGVTMTVLASTTLADTAVATAFSAAATDNGDGTFSTDNYNFTVAGAVLTFTAKVPGDTENPNAVLQTTASGGTAPEFVYSNGGTADTLAFTLAAAPTVTTPGTDAETEETTVSFGTTDTDTALNAGESVTVAGLTYTSTGVTTVGELAAAFANIAQGTTPANPSTGTFSGPLSADWTSFGGTTTTTSVNFTAVSSGDIADIPVSANTATSPSVEITQGTDLAEAGALQYNNLEAGDLMINGAAIRAANANDDTASYDAATSSSKLASGIAIAAAINDSADVTGVTAEVQATEAIGTLATSHSAGGTGTLYINGVSVALTDQGTLEDNISSAVDAINSIAGQTGVMAEDNGEGVTLTAADGRNVVVALDTNAAGDANGGVAAAQFGLGDIAGEADITLGTAAGATAIETAKTTYANVKLSAASNFTVEAGSNGSQAVSDLGLRIGEFGGGASGVFLKDIDISTFEGAQEALASIDNALNTISDVRANLGAINNRLEFTIGNLSNVVENTSAARSRIEDADYAAESAALSRAQILQQAGTAMLAQANAAPQSVLSLLQ